jgi:hypothetical protein
MSNRTGDRYACTDPNCGCEIEVKQPCGSVSDVGRGSSAPASSAEETQDGYAAVTDRFADHGHGVPSAGNVSQSGFRAESISTSSDAGNQGTTGEGIFGTVGGESDHVHTEGRYGSHLPRKSSSIGEGTSLGPSASGAPRCFCGSEMREAGVARVRTASA